MSYPNLLGQNAYFSISEKALGDILGLTRIQIRRRLAQDSFTVDECMVLCDYYDKPFEWLFARQERLNLQLGCGNGMPSREKNDEVKNPVAMQKACLPPQRICEEDGMAHHS